MLLSIDQFKALASDDQVIILDTRSLDDLVQGYIPGSIHASKQQIGKLIAIDLLQLDSPVVLVTPIETINETLLIFEKLGFTNIKGVLQGGYQAWISAGNKFDILIDVDVDELAMDIPFDEFLMVLDVRTENEYNKAHIKNSIALPLFELADPGSMSELDEHFNIYIVSENEEDASIAATILKKQGIHNNRIVNGGWESILAIKEKFTIQSTKIKSTDDSTELE